MNLLVITQKVDLEDSNLGFFHCWLEKFAQKLDKLYVICLWQGKYNLPQNTIVYSMGKERGYSKLSQLFRLQKFLLRHLKEVDGVFIHMCPIYAVASYPLVKIFRKKMILWYVHKSVNPTLKLAEKCVDKILTASPESCRLKNRKKIEVLGHGIDNKLFKPLFSNPEPRIPNTFKILFAGRVAPIKDLETLIKAIDILVNQRSIKNIEVKIIGELVDNYGKKYFEKLKNLVQENKLGNYIQFLGGVPHREIVSFYRQSDIFVNLSPTGGMDKAVLEAMACGIPVLVCNKTFEKDLAKFKDILIFQEKTPQDLAKKILSIKEINRAEVSNYLKDQVVKRHNLDNLISKIVDVFQK